MIKFGPSGNSERFYSEGNKVTEQAPKWLHTMGLNAFEYSFGRGVSLSQAKCDAIREQALQWGVEISCHAPYYINFANEEDEMAQKSFEYLFAAAEKTRALGGKRIVFHPGSMGKLARQQAWELTQRRMEKFAGLAAEKGFDDLFFCPESMGKQNQIGTIAEVAHLCTFAPFFLPAIDFGHENARNFGSLKSTADFERIFEILQKELPFFKVDGMHIHFSKIEYSRGGEVRHLTFADQIYGPEFLPLAQTLRRCRVEKAVVICESDGTQADDAAIMRQIYRQTGESIC